jgi:hypothetical protein
MDQKPKKKKKKHENLPKPKQTNKTKIHTVDASICFLLTVWAKISNQFPSTINNKQNKK